MKRWIFYCIGLAVHFQPIHPCPSCVAKVKPETPPYFSDEFYRPNQYKTVQTAQEYGMNTLKNLLKEKRKGTQ